MTRYLLDTTALIDFSKGREPARSRVMQMIEDGHELAVCAVNVAEFYAGLSPAQRPGWDEFVGALQYWEITWEAARQAGIYRHDFARKGVALSTADTLVAAVAEEQRAVIVTNNVKDYPIGGLRLLPLRG
ncbi:MAG: type II toxin-antitoxin system VapC family toxin [Deinococcus sp.]|nr:type II toxin-antitoxin system VapC family toxin [Deinococcus sp.]